MNKYNIMEDKGYTGLANLGNTCFLNSCMQALSHTHELTNLLTSSNYKKHLKPSIPENIILNEWNNLREIMWSQNGVVAPKRFVHNVQQLAAVKDRDLFTGWAQNDLPEFLLFIVECMHNSISRSVILNIKGKTKNKVDTLAISCYKMLKRIYSTEYSEIMEMFYGIYVSELSSKNNKTIHSLTPESYFILDLEIPGKLAPSPPPLPASRRLLLARFALNTSPSCHILICISCIHCCWGPIIEPGRTIRNQPIISSAVNW